MDANDRVIDVMARGEIHRLGLMHRSVHILVFNSREEFFIQKRSMTKDSNPGLWDSSAAGHVDSGEDYLCCARRELDEELGIHHPGPLEPLFHMTASASTGMEHCTVYRCLHDGPMVLQAEEIEEGAWIPLAEMDSRMAAQDPVITPVLKLIWQTFRDL